MSEARAAYDEWHNELGTTETDGVDTPWTKMLAPYLSSATGKRVLEIGCGRGTFARHLTGLGAASVTACDFSFAAIALASRLSDKPMFLLADIQRIPFGSASFDVVVSCETIEHVPEPRRAVEELVRVLRPGGHLLLTTPNYLGLTGLYRIYLRLRGRRFTEIGQPINKLTMLPITRHWVRTAGLEIIEAHTEGHYVPWPGRDPICTPRVQRVPFVGRHLGLHSMIVASKSD